MNPNNVIAAVRLGNTAKDAVRKIVELDIIVVPVIDDANQIIGGIKPIFSWNALKPERE